MARAPLGELAAGQLLQMLAADDDLARVGVVQAADQIENGGLAGARRAHQGDELPCRDFQVEPVQDFDGFLAAAVMLDHLA